MKGTLIGLIVAMVVWGCSSSSGTKSTLDTSAGDVEDVQTISELPEDFSSQGSLCGSSFETFAFLLHNQHRREKKLAEFECDATLTKVAHDFSQLMCDLDFFDHETTGSTSESRLDDAGVKWTAWGENIAQGQSSPQNVVASWIKSDEHRTNVEGNFKQLGVGYSNCGGKHLWTAVYVR